MMTPVIGVKSIKASGSMTKKAYCEYRGWAVPADEDPDELVVLVEYEPEEGKTSNHPNHQGHISMSPLAVFEKAYKMPHVTIVVPDFKLAPFQLRVVEEAKALNAKIESLSAFIFGRVAFSGLEKDQQDVIKSQYSAMIYYFTCLSERICEFEELPVDLGFIGDHFGFGQALDALKNNKKVAREGWNGKDMFVYLVGEASYPAQTGVAKDHFGEESMVPYNAYMAIKNVNNTISTWVPSVNDCLSEDWYIVE